MHTMRRLFLALAIFCLAFLIFSKWREGRSGYGLLDLLKGQRPPGETVALATGPKLELGDLQVLEKLNEESSKLAAAVLPCVVSINTKTIIPGQRYIDPFMGRIFQGRNRESSGLGSGAFISKEGHIITNNHVIEGVSQVQITTQDGKAYPARLVGVAKRRDLAVLKVDVANANFPALAFADSDAAKVGQIVFAVGNPFGLSGTVTQGIISARDRHLSDSELEYFQTDTVINPGNSGGPLVNIRGEIVGVNVAIYQGEQSRTWQGVGLAIPSNDAKEIVDGILANMKGRPAAAGYLGLSLGDQLVRMDPAFGAGAYAALIEEIVPGSPAEIAGLLVDDLIISLDGKTFRSPQDLFAQIRAKPAGAKVKIVILRDGEKMEIQATLGPRPET
jgi:S1-C subfamily serine protease